ncbi:Restriction of telomere capping protein 4 [Trichoderma simmonsii]|uniref:Restriction of telomere capping protein 4 n=1 Tax=Trichoderma simmonsii TaxID=1491479 RepID=A0A8G0PFA4_9HYPO|nr:Restriction of telomere capping protein 4 [Trichoderma simmonsii]
MVTPPVRRSRTEAKTKTKTTTTTTTTEAAPKPKPESRTQTRRSQIKIPEPVPDEPVLDDIFAPPLASSDLEDEGTAEDADDNVEAEQPIADSSDSDDAPPRGAISSTTFTSQSQKGGRQTRRSTLKEVSKLKEEPEESQSTAKKRKRPADGSPEKSKPKKNALPKRDPTVQPLNMASHLLNAQGFTKQSKVKATFGKKNLLAQGIRLPKGLEEPSTPVKFKEPPGYGTNTPRQSWKFLVPDSVGADSPIKRTRKLNMVEPILYEGEDEDAEDADEDDEEDDDTVTYSQPGSFTGDAKRAAKDKSKAKRKANPLRSRKSTAVKGEPKEDAATITSSPPPAKFVMPAQLSDFVPPGNGNGDDIGDGDLSDASSSGLSSLGSLFPDKEGDGGAQCPWCGATVDMKLLKDFSNGKRLNVRLQTKFCEEHRKKSAMKTWESKAYPEVEWSTLESRFKKHQTHLLDIINGEESFYRTRLAAKIEQGQGRSMKKEENLNPGYYGPRGFNMMCDYLVKEYSDMLKKKAVHDKVIAGRGSAAFIQAVLVAELGVQLIMEDMLVSPEEARHILEESKPIGDLVHADNWL